MTQISLRHPYIRLSLLIGFLVCAYVGSAWSGLFDGMSPITLRDQIQALGSIGIAAYFAIFAIALLLGVPGIVFMLAGGLIYGTGWGFIVTFLAANFAILFCFTVIRLLGGDLSAELDNKRLIALRQGLKKNPFKSIFIMRFLFTTSPILNALFAVSPVSYREHFGASFAGLVVPVAVFVYFADWLILRFYS